MHKTNYLYMKNVIKYIIAGCFLWVGWGASLQAQTGAPVRKDTSAIVVDYQSVTSPTTVSGATLARTPTPNITNTLYGQLQGLTVQGVSGQPGYDAANMYIRGIGSYDNAALVLYVDGFQTTATYFQYLSPAEIESITVLKDPVTLATFGMKGANGVLWVTTKRGMISKPKVQINLVSGLQQAVNIDKPLGSYDYARLYNEAVSNDNYSLNAHQFNWTPAYSDAQLQAYQNGTGTNVDWYNQVLKKSGVYSDANVLFSGGDTTTKYGFVFDYMDQGGLYNVSNSASTSNAFIQRKAVSAFSRLPGRNNPKVS